MPAQSFGTDQDFQALYQQHEEDVTLSSSITITCSFFFSFFVHLQKLKAIFMPLTVFIAIMIISYNLNSLY